MQASLLYFVGCPSWQEAGRRLRIALDQLGQPAVRIDYVPVESGTAPGFHGSPTILVDGVDLFPGGVISDELTCRVYRVENGLGGVPDLADLVTALRERTRRPDPGGSIRAGPQPDPVRQPARVVSHVS